MARRPITPRQRLEELLEQHEPEIRAAFMAAIDNIRSKAEIGRIAALLERGDIDGAVRAVHLDPAAFRAFERAIADAYHSGGTAAVDGLPQLRDPSGGRVLLRFDARNPRAEAWLQQHSSTLVTAIIADQRQAIRTALEAGMLAGDNPRRTALNIVGRIDRATGRRTGGVIGLTEQQASFAASARAELLSGDPAAMRRYLARTRRDRRFDRTIMAAIREERPVDAATVQRIAGRYSDRLLELRGTTIARTETLSGLHASQREAFEQAVETGAVRRQDVRKIWRSAADSKVRDSHVDVNGESVGMDERFSNGLLHPHETGAPAAEVINCRCDVTYRIDFLANVA